MSSHRQAISLRHLVPAGCLLVLMAGCAGVPGAGPTAAPTGSQFDGLYQGENRLIRGDGFLCGPPSYPESIAVSQGGFAYNFAVDPPRTTPMPVQVAADGSVRGQMQYAVQDYTPRSNIRTSWVTVTGQISGPMLDATVADERCSRRLILQKR
jgi:hypothetical protein